MENCQQWICLITKIENNFQSIVAAYQYFLFTTNYFFPKYFTD